MEAQSKREEGDDVKELGVGWRRVALAFVNLSSHRFIVALIYIYIYFCSGLARAEYFVQGPSYTHGVNSADKMSR